MAAVALLDAPLAARPASPAAVAATEPTTATASFGEVLQDARIPTTTPAAATAPVPEMGIHTTAPPAELTAPATKTATGPAVKASLKPATTLADLLATLPGSIVASSESEPATVTAPKLAAEPELLATELPPSTASPQAAPDPFLNWLAAVKEVTSRMPTSTVAEAPPTTAAITDAASLTTALTEVVVAGIPSTELAAATTPAATPFAAALTAAPQTMANAPVATPPPASPPLAMDTPDWPQRLGEQIQWRLGEGIQEARIEITPRELGLVDVRLSMDDGGLRVHLSAAHAQTRELLQSELPRLREWLQQGGVQLADAQVGREAPGQRSHAEQGQAQQGRSQGGLNSDESESSSAATTTQVWRQRRGLLDDYA